MTYVAYACLMTVLLHMPISWLLCCKRLPQDLCYVCLSHDNCVTCTRRRSRKHNTGLVVLSLDTVWSATPRKHPRSNSECVCVFGGRGGRGALEFFYLVWMPGVGIAGDLSLCSRIPGYTGYISQAVLLLFLCSYTHTHTRTHARTHARTHTSTYFRFPPAVGKVISMNITGTYR